METAPREEQECLITLDRELNEWHYYSDVPTLNRKWEHVVDAERKEYNSTGQITLLEGTVTGSVSIRAKRELTDEQKAALTAQLHKGK